MNETQITRIIMQKWKDGNPNSIWYHKVADPTYGANQTNNRAVDVLGCYDGRAFAMEWKLKKNINSFPFKRVRLNQIETLCDVAISGGMALIMIATYIDTKNKYVHAIPIQAWNRVVKNYVKTSSQKSINIEKYFDEYRIDCNKQGSRDVWTINRLEMLFECKEL